jgi:hypothetical protein
MPRTNERGSEPGVTWDARESMIRRVDGTLLTQDEDRTAAMLLDELITMLVARDALYVEDREAVKRADRAALRLGEILRLPLPEFDHVLDKVIR